VELRQGTVDDALADEGVRLRLGGGERVEARRLLLATGLADELPAIGLAPLWGHSAFHCPYCHGFEVSGRRLAVLRHPDMFHAAVASDPVIDCYNSAVKADPQPDQGRELASARVG
jgi:thioredoxin reductase